MTRDSQGFFVADGLSFTKPDGSQYDDGTFWVRVEPVSPEVATSCPWDPEWDDVEEWFNTYKELLEREEEEHG